MPNSSFDPNWVAAVMIRADRLADERKRACCDRSPPDCLIAEQGISRARLIARRSGLDVTSGRLKWIRRQCRRIAAWWTGNEVDRAWAALHEASQALLIVATEEEVTSQLTGIASAVESHFDPKSQAAAEYFKFLSGLASRPLIQVERPLTPVERPLTLADRVQLRVIMQACDDASTAGHTDARAYRNTLILIGSVLAAVLLVVAIIAGADDGFRSAFSPNKTVPGPWYILELEVVASLAGLTGAVLSLHNYSGFQYAYGLPFVQAFLKATAGAATGLFGVLLVQSGLVSFVKPQVGIGVFAVAVVFGYAQHAFTRLIDQQAKNVLSSAGPRPAAAASRKPPAG